MTQLSCGHFVDGGFWQVEYIEMVNNLDGGKDAPALVPATVTATYCNECKEAAEYLLSAEWLE